VRQGAAAALFRCGDCPESEHFPQIQLGMNRAYDVYGAANGHADAFGIFSATISAVKELCLLF
jgi:hypothetical protein